MGKTQITYHQGKKSAFSSKDRGKPLKPLNSGVTHSDLHLVKLILAMTRAME